MTQDELKKLALTMRGYDKDFNALMEKMTKENADDDEFEQLENIMKKYSVLQISMGEKLDKSMSVEEESKMIEDKQSIVTELTSVLGDVETIIESMMGKTEEAPVEEQTEEAPVEEQTPEDLAKIMYKL